MQNASAPQQPGGVAAQAVSPEPQQSSLAGSPYEEPGQHPPPEVRAGADGGQAADDAGSSHTEFHSLTAAAGQQMPPQEAGASAGHGVAWTPATAQGVHDWSSQETPGISGQQTADQPQQPDTSTSPGPQVGGTGGLPAVGAA
jgi:hypothetical protein